MSTIVRLAATRLFWVAVVAAACWAAFAAMWERWSAPWGSSWGAWIFCAALIFWTRMALNTKATIDRHDAFSRDWLIAATGFIVLYAALFPYVPKLVSCELAVMTMGCVMIGVLPAETRAVSWGLFPLLAQAPLVSTAIDFLVGYPLRLCAAKLAAVMLMGNVAVVGTGLSYGGSVVFVDAPCSGIRMLSASLVLAGALSLLLRFRLLPTLALLASSVLLALFGDAHRAASLVLVNIPPDVPAHALIGIVVFVECSVLLLVTAKFFHRRQPRLVRSEGVVHKAGPSVKSALLLACATAASLTMLPGGIPAASANTTTVPWPKTWQGEPLNPMPLPSEWDSFLSGFPGAWAQFRVGDTGKVVLMRYCTAATRMLHPAENCYLALGGRCMPMSSLRDERGHVWSRFEYADPDGSRRVVSQCYFAPAATDAGDPFPAQAGELSDWLHGATSWSDASAWYWAASLPGSRVFATLAITVAEPEPSRN